MRGEGGGYPYFCNNFYKTFFWYPLVNLNQAGREKPAYLSRKEENSAREIWPNCAYSCEFCFYRLVSTVNCAQEKSILAWESKIRGFTSLSRQNRVFNQLFRNFLKKVLLWSCKFGFFRLCSEKSYFSLYKFTFHEALVKVVWTPQVWCWLSFWEMVLRHIWNKKKHTLGLQSVEDFYLYLCCLGNLSKQQRITKEEIRNFCVFSFHGKCFLQETVRKVFSSFFLDKFPKQHR